MLIDEHCEVGSPPHTRERPSRYAFAFLSSRITPAYAGKTTWKGDKPSLKQDHPRIRGKDTVTSSDDCPMCGSPPHTRERPFSVSYRITSARITPAYAGKTVTIPNNINTLILEFKIFYSLYISVLLIAYFLYLRAL